MNLGHLAAIVVGVVVFALIISIFAALPIMLLWNAIVPAIFGLPAISFWQAFGLNLLSALLIRSHCSSSK